MAMTQFRLLHVMLRVRDLEKSIDFYQRFFSMQLLRRIDFESGGFTLAFIGYGEEADNFVIELTHNWDQKEPYDIGTAYGHIALGVDDIYAVCKRLANEGAHIVREPGPMKHGSTHIAFIKDPDGYLIELLEKK